MAGNDYSDVHDDVHDDDDTFSPGVLGQGCDGEGEIQGDGEEW